MEFDNFTAQIKSSIIQEFINNKEVYKTFEQLQNYFDEIFQQVFDSQSTMTEILTILHELLQDCIENEEGDFQFHFDLFFIYLVDKIIKLIRHNTNIQFEKSRWITLLILLNSQKLMQLINKMKELSFGENCLKEMILLIMHLLNLSEILIKKKKLCPEYFCGIETLIYQLNSLLNTTENNKETITNNKNSVLKLSDCVNKILQTSDLSFDKEIINFLNKQNIIIESMIQIYQEEPNCDYLFKTISELLQEQIKQCDKNQLEKLKAITQKLSQLIQKKQTKEQLQFVKQDNFVKIQEFTPRILDDNAQEEKKLKKKEKLEKLKTKKGIKLASKQKFKQKQQMHHIIEDRQTNKFKEFQSFVDRQSQELKNMKANYYQPNLRKTKIKRNTKRLAGNATEDN